MAIKSDELAGELDLAANVLIPSYLVVLYTIYLNLKSESVNSKDVIINCIESLLFASVGVLTAKELGGDLELYH